MAASSQVDHPQVFGRTCEGVRACHGVGGCVQCDYTRICTCTPCEGVCSVCLHKYMYMKSSWFFLKPSLN